MRILIGVVPWIVLAVGILAYRGAWLCHVRPERAGCWNHRWTGVVLLTFLATMTGPLMRWMQGEGQDGVESGLLRLAFLIAALLLYAPLLTFHASEFLTKLLRQEPQPPPEPTDPFERAVAAEERGDVRGAIERYSRLLEEEPAHAGARTRLAGILARTRRFRWATEVIEQGLALEGPSSVEKAEWEACCRIGKKGSSSSARPAARISPSTRSPPYASRHTRRPRRRSPRTRAR